MSGVRLHISSLVKFLLKSSKDILDRNTKEECLEKTISGRGIHHLAIPDLSSLLKDFWGMIFLIHYEGVRTETLF